MCVPDGVTIADLRTKQSGASTLILLDGKTLATRENVDVELITTGDLIAKLGIANHDDIELSLGERGSDVNFEQQVLELVNKERVREDLPKRTHYWRGLRLPIALIWHCKTFLVILEGMGLI